MCAIVSSKDPSKFTDLLYLNKDRGTFASSFIVVSDKETHIVKKQGLISEYEVCEYIHEAQQQCSNLYYVGHVQAPTSAMRDWTEETSHPFCSKDWIVIHNGVLTNHHDIFTTVKVDTECICKILQSYSAVSNTTEIDCIRSTCKALKGTFALFIINKNTNNMYITRQGSILHYNDDGDVSSLHQEGMKLLPEGIIMNFIESKWVNCGSYEAKSPFLFL